MDSLGTANMSAFSSSDPKTTLMNQVRQEAAIQNAKQLVEVRLYTPIFLVPDRAPCSLLDKRFILILTSANISKKLNEHCFERCVPKPASTLSKGEETCFSQCMEKYMGAWNTVSRQYIGIIQKEAGSTSISGTSL